MNAAKRDEAVSTFGKFEIENTIEDELASDSEPSETEDGEDASIASVYYEDQTPSFHARETRLKGHYHGAYRKLFNAVVAETTAAYEFDHDGSGLNPSQIGTSIWSPVEKHIFFQTLTRLGRHAVHEIASAIATKSELEVSHYLHLLHEGSVEENATSQRAHFALSDVEAATEISVQCEEALELAAEALNWQIEKSDRKAEEERYADPLLDKPLAYEIKHGGIAVEVSDSRWEWGWGAPYEALKDPTRPAPTLFEPWDWLQVSQLYMNNGFGFNDKLTAEVIGVEHQETPSIFQSALADFSNLAVSLTRRLVQASITQAMSRRRATEHNDPEDAVRLQDVLTARNVLGLKDDWSEFWVTWARRNDVQVTSRSKKDKEKGVKATPLSYEEVEARLRNEPRPNGDEQSENTSSSIEQDDVDEMYENSDCWTDTSSETDNEVDVITYPEGTNHNDPDQDPAWLAICSPKVFQSVEDSYVERIDAATSTAEEARLWAVVDQKPPWRILPKELKPPEIPPIKRKRPEDMRDWREDCTYVPPWVRYDEPVTEEAFAKMEKRGRAGKKKRLDAYERIASKYDGHNLPQSTSGNHGNLALSRQSAENGNLAPENGETPPKNTSPSEEGASRATVEKGVDANVLSQEL